MSLPTTEKQAQVTSAAAEIFVETFYNALTQRHNLSPYYVSASPKLTAASVVPDISINGNVVHSVADFEDMLEKQGGPVSYEVMSYDAHAVNPNYIVGAPESAPNRDGDKLSFATQVSGVVTYGKGENAVEKNFNEAFVLVPHWEAQTRNASRNARRWLILSQNFRAL